jgi:hypothetical protein
LPYPDHPVCPRQASALPAGWTQLQKPPAQSRLFHNRQRFTNRLTINNVGTNDNQAQSSDRTSHFRPPSQDFRVVYIKTPAVRNQLVPPSAGKMKHLSDLSRFLLLSVWSFGFI